MSQLRSDDPWLGSERSVRSPDPVAAWRKWRLRPDEWGAPLLGSVHEDYIWSAGTVQAECNPARTWSYRIASDAADESEHQAPAEGCRCGMYAYATPDLARPVGPGVWLHGRILVAGPMFVTDSGCRGREATIAGQLELVAECVGGDDLISPARCFSQPTVVKFGPKVYYPICASHQQAPIGKTVAGLHTMAEFIHLVSFLASRLETFISVPIAL